MKIIDLLKQFGIIQSGSMSASYKNAKDRPTEFQSEDYIGNHKSGAKSKNGKSNRPSKKIIIYSIIALLIFWLLSQTTTVALFIVLIWLVWVIYVWLIYVNKIVAFKFSLTFAFTILCVFSLLMVFVAQADGDLSTNGTSTKALSVAECQPYYDIYNDKVYNISSDGLQGTIGIKIDMENGCKLQGIYNVLLSHNLPQNPYKRDTGPSYRYIVMLRTSNQTDRSKYDGHGELSPVFKNFTSLPNPFDDSVKRSELYSQGMQPVETRYFSWGYTLTANFSEKRIQEILDNTKMDIVDGLPFVEEEQDSGGVYSYSVNDDRAAESGTIVKSYDLIIE